MGEGEVEETAEVRRVRNGPIKVLGNLRPVTMAYEINDEICQFFQDYGGEPVVRVYCKEKNGDGELSDKVIFTGVPSVTRVVDKYLRVLGIGEVIHVHNEWSLSGNHYVEDGVFTDKNDALDYIVKSPLCRNPYWCRELGSRLILEAKLIEDAVVGGFYPDGLHLGVISKFPVAKEEWLNNCDLEGKDENASSPLGIVDYIRWVEDNYPQENRLHAIFDAWFLTTGLFEIARKTKYMAFEGRIDISTGTFGLGKTRNAFTVINLLGLNNSIVLGSSSEVLGTSARISHQLSLTTVPWVINDVNNPEALKRLLEIAQPGVTELTVIKVHASKEGPGVSAVFAQLRPLLVITNLSKAELLRVIRESGLVGQYRRAYIHRWDDKQPGKTIEVGEPRRIIGCLREMWMDASIREKLLSQGTIYDLMTALADAFRDYFMKKFEEANIPQKVREDFENALSLIRQVVLLHKAAELEEASRRRREVSYEEEFLRNLRGKAKEVTPKIGLPYNIVGILASIIEQPGEYGVYVYQGRCRNEDFEEWDTVYEELKKYAPSGSMRQDIDSIMSFLTEKAQECRKIVVPCDSELVNGCPNFLFNTSRARYPVYNEMRHGYSFTLAKLARILLESSTINAVEEGDGSETD